MKSKMRILRKGMAMLVISALLLGMVQVVSGSTTYPLPSASPESLATMKSNVRNGFFDYDITVDPEGGGSHPQGICVDDAYEYLYLSYGTLIYKVDLATGVTVGKLGGLTGRYHFGDVSYYDGRVYCASYWEDVDYKSFVTAIDEDAWPTDGSTKTVDLEKDGADVHGFLLKDIVDFKAGQSELGKSKFRSYAIDGLCFGKYPGDKSGDTYMFTSYGGDKFNESSHAYDDDYVVIGAYKVDNFIGNENVDIPLTTDRISSSAYNEAELLASDKLLFLLVGGVQYGNAQNMSYDKDTGDIVLVPYDSTKGWNTNLNGVMQTMTSRKYVIDGSKAPINKTLELGQSNQDTNETYKNAAIARAELYKENGVMPTGDHAVLKCICGKGDIDAHEAVPTAYSTAHVERYSDAVGVDAGLSDVKLCFRAKSAREEYGQVSLGDGYYYATYDYKVNDEVTVKKVRLYRRDENYMLTAVEEIPKEPGENLLVNGDFEESETNETLNTTVATGWDVGVQTYENPKDCFEYLSTAGADGNAYIRVKDLSRYYSYVQQTGIPFEAGKVYTLSFDYKTTVQSGSAPYIRIIFSGTNKTKFDVDFGYQAAGIQQAQDGNTAKFTAAKGTENDFLGSEYTANEWHKVSVTFVCPPGEWTTNSCIQLKPVPKKDAEYYYDNVSLVEEKAESLGYYNANGDAITGIANDVDGKATFRSVGDGTAEGKTVTLLSAYYSKEGNQLLGIYPAVTGTVGTRTTFANVTETTSFGFQMKDFHIVKNMELDIPFTAPKEGDFLIKTFVWDSVSKLKPVAPGISLPKAAE